MDPPSNDCSKERILDLPSRSLPSQPISSEPSWVQSSVPSQCQLSGMHVTRSAQVNSVSVQGLQTAPRVTVVNPLKVDYIDQQFSMPRGYSQSGAVELIRVVTAVVVAIAAPG